MAWGSYAISATRHSLDGGPKRGEGTKDAAKIPPHGLARVVHQDVQGLVPFRDERAERLDAAQIPQVQAVHLQTTAPLVRVGLSPCADACVRAMA